MPSLPKDCRIFQYLSPCFEEGAYPNSVMVRIVSEVAVGVPARGHYLHSTTSTSDLRCANPVATIGTTLPDDSGKLYQPGTVIKVPAGMEYQTAERMEPV